MTDYSAGLKAEELRFYSDLMRQQGDVKQADRLAREAKVLEDQQERIVEASRRSEVSDGANDRREFYLSR